MANELDEIDRKIIHKMILFQTTIMYALHHIVDTRDPRETNPDEVRQALQRRMAEGREMMQELNTALQREHDGLLAQIGAGLDHYPKN